MSITQTNRPKRSHVFFLKLALGVFVLIFAAMIFLNQMKAKGIADFLANKPETRLTLISKRKRVNALVY